MRPFFLTIWNLAIPFSSALAMGETQTLPTLAIGDLLQVSISLMVVLIAIAFAAWLLRHFTKLGGAMGGALKILGGVSLGGRERVVLMQVGDRQILLGVAPGSVRTLYIVEQPLPISRPPADFSLVLRSTVRDQEPL
ncbi:flagellar protein FliO/FliZ [Gammaproteobacteria bacterium]